MTCIKKLNTIIQKLEWWKWKFGNSLVLIFWNLFTNLILSTCFFNLVVCKEIDRIIINKCIITTNQWKLLYLETCRIASLSRDLNELKFTPQILCWLTNQQAGFCYRLWLVGQHQIIGGNFKQIGHVTCLLPCKDSSAKCVAWWWR